MIPTPEFSEKLDALRAKFEEYLKYQDPLDIMRANWSGEGNKLVDDAPESAKIAYREYEQLCERASHWKDKRK